MALCEQKIQKKIIDFLELNGAYVVKVIKANKSGVNDLLVCLDGKFISIEVKTEIGVLSPLQEYHIKLVEKAGGIAFVAKSLEDVKKHLTI